MTLIRPIDITPAKPEVREVGDLTRYRDDKGHVFSLTAEKAAELGYEPVNPPSVLEVDPASEIPGSIEETDSEPTEGEQLGGFETEPEEEPRRRGRAATKAMEPGEDK